MRCFRLFLIALGLAGCAGTRATQPLSTNLDGLITFGDPQICAESEPFATLLKSLFRYDAASDRASRGVPKISAEFSRALGSARYRRSRDGIVVVFHVAGTWRGLHLRKLVAYAWDGGDPGGFILHFDEPFDRTLSVINRQGFGLPSGGVRDLDNSEIKVVSEGHGSLFGCTA